MMKYNPGHQPQRFRVYEQLSNGKGFTIKKSNHIYYFDKYGGWFDQYENYYDADGNPSQQPFDQYNDKYDDNYDDYDRIYGLCGILNDSENYSEDDYCPQDNVSIQISKNLACLDQYSNKQIIRLRFHNIEKHMSSEEIRYYFEQKEIQGILNVVLDKDHRNLNTGQGSIIAENITTVQKLINFEGKIINGLQIHFSLDSFATFMMKPILKQQFNYANSNRIKIQSKQQQKIRYETRVLEQDKKVKNQKVNLLVQKKKDQKKLENKQVDNKGEQKIQKKQVELKVDIKNKVEQKVEIIKIVDNKVDNKINSKVQKQKIDLLNKGQINNIQKKTKIKKYVKKNIINQKKQQSTSKVNQTRQKQLQKVSTEIVNNKKQKKHKNDEQWTYCKVDVSMFEYKSQFHTWMKDRGFLYNKDYQNIVNLESSKGQRIIQLQIKKQTQKFLKGSTHNSQKVIFKRQEN